MTKERFLMAKMKRLEDWSKGNIREDCKPHFTPKSAKREAQNEGSTTLETKQWKEIKNKFWTKSGTQKLTTVEGKKEISHKQVFS